MTAVLKGSIPLAAVLTGSQWCSLVTSRNLVIFTDTIAAVLYDKEAMALLILTGSRDTQTQF